MTPQFEFLDPNDKPALLGISNQDLLTECRSALEEMGYKTHIAHNHGEFDLRFAQVKYQVVVLEEAFEAFGAADNYSLQSLQTAAMIQRRHATIFLIGPSFQSLNPFQAFAQSVHAVINPVDLPSLKAIFKQIIGDTEMFLHVYRDTALRVATGKV